MFTGSSNSSQKQKSYYEKNIALVLGSLLVFCFTAAAEPGAADQRWLEAAQKMLAKGETKVSTPSLERVNLIKKWAVKQGLIVKVVKTELGYRLDLSGNIAQR